MSQKHLLALPLPWRLWFQFVIGVLTCGMGCIGLQVSSLQLVWAPARKHTSTHAHARAGAPARSHAQGSLEGVLEWLKRPLLKILPIMYSICLAAARQRLPTTWAKALGAAWGRFGPQGAGADAAVATPASSASPSPTLPPHATNAQAPPSIHPSLDALLRVGMALTCSAALTSDLIYSTCVPAPLRAASHGFTFVCLGACVLYMRQVRAPTG